MLAVDSELKEKGVVLMKDSIPQITKIAKSQQRNFSGQLRYIIDLYLNNREAFDKIANGM